MPESTDYARDISGQYHFNPNQTTVLVDFGLTPV